jgi:antitoxin (DNA-binding transcriptional repressor) of toxin-antitoxin stability system
MDAVEAGETMVVTRNGVPVAELKPIRRHRLTPVSELRQAFAAGPDPDFAAMRADIDAYFGEDRIGDE